MLQRTFGTQPAALVGRRSGVQLIALKADLQDFFNSDNEEFGDEDDFTSSDESSSDEASTVSRQTPRAASPVPPRSILRTPMDRRLSMARVNFAAASPMHERFYHNDDDDDDDFDNQEDHFSGRPHPSVSFHEKSRSRLSFHDQLHFSTQEPSRHSFVQPSSFHDKLHLSPAQEPSLQPSFHDKSRSRLHSSSASRDVSQQPLRLSVPGREKHRSVLFPAAEAAAEPAKPVVVQRKRARPAAAAKRPSVYDEPLSEMTTIDIDDPNDKTFHLSDEESEADFSRHTTALDENSVGDPEITRLTPFKANPHKPAVFCGGTVHRVSPRVAFVPPEAHQPGLRRSKRHRLQPLRFWKGERVSYRNVGCAFEIVDVYISNE